MKKLLIQIVFTLFLCGTFISHGQEHTNLADGVAIHGYDPVAYFQQGEPVKGHEKFAVPVNGTVYYCSSSANERLLRENPEAYLPQYGGWCAFAMGDYGKKVDVNPKTYKITDGKLYLFYNTFPTNTLKSWNRDEEHLRSNADVNWKKITGTKP